MEISRQLTVADLGSIDRLRIAMLAPPWLPVPPTGYGGIESVVALLSDGLADRGHDVTLFAAPGSHSRAAVRTVLPACYPDRIERALHEADHVARVFDAVDQAAATGQPYDLIHDHCGFTAFAMADRIATPLVHTLHGPFTEETSEFYRHHASKAHAVAISLSQQAHAPGALPITAVIANPIDVTSWPFTPIKQDYVLWIGRMVEEKGPHRAITAARAAGVPLILAGPIQTGQGTFFREHVAPHINGSTIRYVGEVGGQRKQRLFAQARGLLVPIRWAEPFGMVMIEAMSCGTPVIAFPEGAAPEIVQHGLTGYLVADETEMASVIPKLSDINTSTCRYHATTRFSVDHAVTAYEAVYRQIAAKTARQVAAPLTLPPKRRHLPATVPH